jgi:diaminopimelate epimerase
MIIPFVKMQGTGNDFIVIERDDIKNIDINAYSKYLNHRHFGIGGDGLLVVDSKDGLYKMTMINPDGSEAMCGNGIRCFALYLIEKGYIKENEFEVASSAGVKKISYASTGGKHYFKVNMGYPILEPSKIPVMAEGENPVVALELDADNKKYIANCVSMGNPHAVIFVDNYESINIPAAGKSIENNPVFPERTNVEFVVVEDRKNIKMRVWERGAGETLACGTGTCASVVASYLKGYVDQTVNVSLLGGDVEIFYSGSDVYMTGEAVTVYSGEIDIEKLKASCPDNI